MGNDPASRCPGSPVNFSVISSDKQCSAHATLAQALLVSTGSNAGQQPRRASSRRADAAAGRSPTSPCRGVLLPAAPRVCKACSWLSGGRRPRTSARAPRRRTPGSPIQGII
jgi:hypothetical protein